MRSVTIFISKLLKNKYFWYAVGGLIIILLLNKYWSKLKTKINWALKPDVIDYKRDADGNIIDLSDRDKAKLDIVAEDLKNDLTGYYSDIFKTHKSEIYSKLKHMSDQELQYVASSYERMYNQNMGEALDDESFGITYDVPDEIINRLIKIGEYKQE